MEPKKNSQTGEIDGEIEQSKLTTEKTLESNKTFSPEEIDAIIEQAFLEEFEDSDNEEDLDLMYRWTKGGIKTDVGHFIVNSNEDLEKVPNGGTYDMTLRKIRILNEEWNSLRLKRTS